MQDQQPTAEQVRSAENDPPRRGSWLYSVIAVLVVVGGGVGLAVTFAGSHLGLKNQTEENKPDRKEAPAAPVVVVAVRKETVEIIATHAGMLRPFERYSLGFEIGGRIQGFNADDSQPHFDEGDLVQQGRVVARLDAAVMIASRDEAAARLEDAQTRLHRAQEILVENPRALAQAEIDTLSAQVKIMQAALRRADELLKDASLIAPADAVISRRWVNPHVAVGPHVPVMELLDVSRLLLTIGVPESRVHDLRVGQPAVATLIGHDLYGRDFPPLSGKVHRIDESADRQTGLFQVEILLPNAAPRFPGAPESESATSLIDSPEPLL
ncbi:MAG: efflux RND transporter periplasmic adaptor subunit, partial [Planctomycetales bacterium]